MNRHNLRKYEVWATDRQIEYLVAIAEHGSIREAAKALGVSRATIFQGVLHFCQRLAGHYL